MLQRIAVKLQNRHRHELGLFEKAHLRLSSAIVAQLRRKVKHQIQVFCKPSIRGYSTRRSLSQDLDGYRQADAADGLAEAGCSIVIMTVRSATTMIWIFWTIAWFTLGEVLMSLADWHGLTIFGRRWLWLTGPILGVLLGLLVTMFEGPSAVVLAGSMAPGLALFAAAALWRRRGLAPETLFAPGERSGRRVRELGLPIEGGPLPAVLVEPIPGAASAVLVVHGAGDHKTHFTWPLLHGLADAGFAVCAIDVDGHGDNPRTLDFPSVLEDVAVGVDWLRSQYRRVALLGISQGGCIAARAVAEGVAVDALVLLETPRTVRVTRAVRRSEMRILAHRAAWSLHREVGSLALARSWHTPPTRTRIGTVELIERLDVVWSVGRISAPLLLVYGGSDAVVPLTQAHEVAAAAPPDTTLLIVRGATHLSLSIDRRVVGRVANWLRTSLSL